MSELKLMLEKPVIIVTVYDRVNHLKQCLESLEAAHGAENYHIIIGSDAPYKLEHDFKINKVREYLKAKEMNHSFKKISVIYHTSNVGENKNLEKCNMLAKSLGHLTFIMMEDDVIVGIHFLDFMNDGLNRFSSNDKVISINGYLDPKIKINQDLPFLYNRFCAYGFASWYDKWDKIQEKRKLNNYADQVLSNKKLFKKLVNISPNAKSYPFLAKSFYQATDIEVGLMMEIDDKWALLPPVSLTANRGMDGSGLRSGNDNNLQNMKPSNMKISFPDIDSIKQLKIEHLNGKLDLSNILENWFSYIIYKYIPFGFNFLKKLRAIKKSI